MNAFLPIASVEQFKTALLTLRDKNLRSSHFADFVSKARDLLVSEPSLAVRKPELK